jgi:UDP-glucose 4-epimerase
MVTGGAGFIGSHLVRKLLDEGNHVVCVDNESSEGHETFRWDDRADNIKSDICDLTRENFENVDVVFHLAAEVSIQRAIENPDRTFRTNVMGTYNVLKNASDAGVKRLVFSSTSAIYGSGGMHYGFSFTEDTPTNCMNIYATTKLMGEQLCDHFEKFTKMGVVTLRYFNVFGEGQANKGTYSPVVAVFQRQLSEGQPLTVVGDGSQVRDYIHVSDVVMANMMVSDLNRGFIKGSRYNIGSGKTFSVLEIARRVGGTKATFRFLPARIGEATFTCADCSKATRDFGWRPSGGLERWIARAD